MAKRVLGKTNAPPSDSKLQIEYKQLNVLVYELAQDHLGIIKSLNLDAKINPSEFSQLRIMSNCKSENFEEAKSLCIKEMESSSHLDSSIWLSFINILKHFDDGISIAKATLLSLKEKIDLRGIKCATLELKISHPSAFSESISEMLFDFAVSMNRKPSTLNDLIYFLKKIENVEIKDFHEKITNHINSVIS